MTLLLLTLLAASPAEPSQVFLDRAQGAIAAGDLAAAAAALDTALALDPDDVDALFAAAMVARRIGRTDAVALLERLVKLDPNADEARLQLALALWEQGNTVAAKAAVNHVLERHPDLPDALAVQTRINGGPPAPPPPWRVMGRVDLAAGYDSNLTLASTALPEVSHQGVGVGLVDLALGASYEPGGRPFSALVRLTSLQPFSDRSRVAPSAATVIGVGLLGRRQLGEIESAVDVRYDEVFTDTFAEHRERVVSPSLYGSMAVGSLQRVRALVGGDYHQEISGAKALASDALVEPSNIVARAGLRDNIAWGQWSFVVDALGRRAFSLSTPAPGGSSREVDFLEFGGQAGADRRLTQTLGAFALVGAASRTFAKDVRPSERTLSAQFGLRMSIDWVELHAEYAYAHNDSATKLWRWDRHTIFAGVRAYTP